MRREVVQDCLLLVAFIVFTSVLIDDGRRWLPLLGSVCVAGQALLLLRRVRTLTSRRTR